MSEWVPQIARSTSSNPTIQILLRSSLGSQDTMARLIAFWVAAAAVFLYADQSFDLIRLALPAPASTARLFDSSYVPKRAVRKGDYATNSLLKDKAQRLFDGQIQGPETVAIDSKGSLFTVDSQNFLWRGRHDGSTATLEAKPLLHLGPGRGLALQFDADDNLVICIAGAGLYLVDMDTLRLILLTARVSSDSPEQPGTAIAYVEDLDIAADGTIYFTDATNIPPRAPDYDIMRPVDLTLFQVIQSLQKGERAVVL